MKNERNSKFLSLVLRHTPDTIGLELDHEGWADIATLLELAARNGNTITPAELQDIVATSDKKRFAISQDGLQIRANQGHSLATVDLGLPAATPPPVLYHGTASRFLDAIRAAGLKPQSRNHVHLSTLQDTSIEVGNRHGRPVILSVDALAMHSQGYQFYLSENGVWLTGQVPKEFIAFPPA